MAFLAFILLFLVTATFQIMRIYNKGLTVKQMNQSGRTITEDIARTARVATTGSVFIDKVPQQRLCVGGMSYVWNNPHDTNDGVNRYDDNTPVDIVRITDPSAEYCKHPTKQVKKGDVNTAVLSSGGARIANMTAKRSADLKLLNLNFTVTTTGSNTPKLVEGALQCESGGSALFGSFCALAEFDTTVYIRNRG